MTATPFPLFPVFFVLARSDGNEFARVLEQVAIHACLSFTAMLAVAHAAVGDVSLA